LVKARCETSRQATIEAISKLKKGRYRHSLTMDGYDRAVLGCRDAGIGAAVGRADPDQ
jgi:hypothetical protein